MRGLRTQCIGLAVEFLHEEVEASSYRFIEIQYARHFFDMGAEAIELFGDVEALQQQRAFLFDARLVDAIGQVADALLVAV